MNRPLGPVRATTPGDAAYARVLRLLTSNVAATTGLEFDRVEDVALATNEAFGQLMRLPATESVTCTAASCDGVVEVTMSGSAGGDGPFPERWPDALAARVLSGVTDAIEYSPDERSIRFRVGAP